MNIFKLNKYEQSIENAIMRGEYKSVSRAEFKRISKAINACNKKTIVNITISQNDLNLIKQKAKNQGVKYQTFISEIIHTIAQRPDKRVHAIH